MSIKYKIALLFALLASIILSIVGLSVFFFSAKERDNTFKTRLGNRAWSTAKIAAAVRDGNYTIVSKLDTASVASLDNKSITVLGNKNKPVYKYTDVPGHELVLTDKIVELTKKNKEYYFKANDRNAVAINYVNADSNFIVAAAATDTEGKSFLGDLKKLLFWGLLVAVILSFLGGLFFANTLIKPIIRIISDVNLISSHNLSQRINQGSTNDELFRLSQTFNDLLDRLQESFIIQRRFISNASHELSTPLTSVSSQLEVALHKNRSAEEYREVLLSINDDVKGLQQLTRSLLDIAKTGTQGSIDLSDVRIDEVLLKVAAEVQKLQASYKVSLNFETLPDREELLTVFGNSNLLHIALKNIIENGCKYSDDHQAVINTTFERSKIIITVHSQGDIIAEADIENIFQPFFRSESTRPKQGFGLGLTLTKRILSLHKATIDVHSSLQKGTIFSIEIPNKIAVV